MLVLALAAIGVTLWIRSAGEETVVRRRLDDLAGDLNASASDGVGVLSGAVQIGSYFTDDVVIDLGRGSAPIRGRATLMEMAARLQMRTSRFTVKLTDVGVTLTDERSADVSLTAEFLERGDTSQEPSLDAREFALVMTKTDGDWRVARVDAVEVFK